MKDRKIPNPNSKLLKQAIIGGAGMGVPPDSAPPPGMAVVLLYVPTATLTGMTPPDIQTDMGLPWAINGGGQAWFDELE